MLPLALAACGDGAAERAVAAQLPDPATARFQNVRETEAHVCGEVNGEYESGARTGYRRFVFDEAAAAALIDPEVRLTEAEVAAFERSCGERGPMGAAFNRGNCQWAADGRRDVERQRRFDTLWRKACSQVR